MANGMTRRGLATRGLAAAVPAATTIPAPARRLSAGR